MPLNSDDLKPLIKKNVATDNRKKYIISEKTVITPENKLSGKNNAEVSVNPLLTSGIKSADKIENPFNGDNSTLISSIDSLNSTFQRSIKELKGSLDFSSSIKEIGRATSKSVFNSLKPYENVAKSKVDDFAKQTVTGVSDVGFNLLGATDINRSLGLSDKLAGLIEPRRFNLYNKEKIINESDYGVKNVRRSSIQDTEDREVKESKIKKLNNINYDNVVNKSYIPRKIPTSIPENQVGVVKTSVIVNDLVNHKRNINKNRNINREYTPAVPREYDRYGRNNPYTISDSATPSIYPVTNKHTMPYKKPGNSSLLVQNKKNGTKVYSMPGQDPNGLIIQIDNAFDKKGGFFTNVLKTITFIPSIFKQFEPIIQYFRQLSALNIAKKQLSTIQSTYEILQGWDSLLVSYLESSGTASEEDLFSFKFQNQIRSLKNQYGISKLNDGDKTGAFIYQKLFGSEEGLSSSALDNLTEMTVSRLGLLKQVKSEDSPDDIQSVIEENNKLKKRVRNQLKNYITKSASNPARDEVLFSKLFKRITKDFKDIIKSDTESPEVFRNKLRRPVDGDTNILDIFSKLKPKNDENSGGEFSSFVENVSIKSESLINIADDVSVIRQLLESFLQHSEDSKTHLSTIKKTLVEQKNKSDADAPREEFNRRKSDENLEDIRDALVLSTGTFSERLLQSKKGGSKSGLSSNTEVTKEGGVVDSVIDGVVDILPETALVTAATTGIWGRLKNIFLGKKFNSPKGPPPLPKNIISSGPPPLPKESTKLAGKVLPSIIKKAAPVLGKNKRGVIILTALSALAAAGVARGANILEGSGVSEGPQINPIPGDNFTDSTSSQLSKKILDVGKFVNPNNDIGADNLKQSESNNTPSIGGKIGGFLPELAKFYLLADVNKNLVTQGKKPLSNFLLHKSIPSLMESLPNKGLGGTLGKGITRGVSVGSKLGYFVNPASSAAFQFLMDFIQGSSFEAKRNLGKDKVTLADRVTSGVGNMMVELPQWASFGFKNYSLEEKKGAITEVNERRKQLSDILKNKASFASEIFQNSFGFGTRIRNRDISNAREDMDLASMDRINSFNKLQELLKDPVKNKRDISKLQKEIKVKDETLKMSFDKFISLIPKEDRGKFEFDVTKKIEPKKDPVHLNMRDKIFEGAGNIISSVSSNVKSAADATKMSLSESVSGISTPVIASVKAMSDRYTLEQPNTSIRETLNDYRNIEKQKIRSDDTSKNNINVNPISGLSLNPSISQEKGSHTDTLIHILNLDLLGT